MRIDIEKFKNIAQKYKKSLIVAGSVFVLMLGMLFVGAGTSKNFFIFPASEKYEIKDVDQKIKEGISLLKSSPPLQYETSNGTHSGALRKKQIAFAILDKKTGDIFEKRFWMDESQAQKARETGILSLVPLENDPDPLRVTVRWWNSFNSMYDTPDDPHLMVIANKYLIERDELPEQTTLLLSLDGPVSKYTDMVYVPYSEDIHWIDVMKEGKDYLLKNIDRAYEELEDNDVISLASPEELITDVIPKEILSNIIFTEQTDTRALLMSDDKGKRLVERVLVILGSNEEWAYKYTGSSAGATGIAQFIEPTYDGMVELYPEAEMIKDYRLGMGDHVNAMKAMVLFLDSHKASLQRSINEDKLTEGITEEMLAATYNGGPSRTIQSVNKYGSGWADSPIFREETRDYIEKYKIIDKLNILSTLN
ncbi:MAG: hypothetical protein ABH833_03095 [Parcubacteria group bacterium]